MNTVQRLGFIHPKMILNSGDFTGVAMNPSLYLGMLMKP